MACFGERDPGTKKRDLKPRHHDDVSGGIFTVSGNYNKT